VKFYNRPIPGPETEGLGGPGLDANEATAPPAVSLQPGRLEARPGQFKLEESGRWIIGLQSLGLDDKRDALLYVPSSYTPDHPAALVMMLHGAGGDAEHSMPFFQPLAEAANLLVLAPPSRAKSWDIIYYDRFGPDVAFINRALAKTFERYAIDPNHLAIGGFSDGASYALCLGLANGDLFTHVMAFSPGFMAPPQLHGKPSVFISHGTGDRILPIERCSRKIVPRLEKDNYKINYREFEGPHTVPATVINEALSWFVA
jgi:predicted esterase